MARVMKHYQRRKLVRVKQVIRLGTDPTFTESLQALGFSGRVNTAFIERVNLTLRRGVAALARRTWATALQTPHLQAHLQWWQAYYHGCRVLMPRCAWPWLRHEREMIGR
jgi:hypothetical protein